MNDHLEFIVPKVCELSKLIKLYSIHYSDDPDFNQKIVNYPNFTPTINVYKHSKISWNHLSRNHEYAPEEEMKIPLVGKSNKSGGIHTKEKFRKLTIVFHPLGLNHFVEYFLFFETSFIWCA